MDFLRRHILKLIAALLGLVFYVVVAAEKEATRTFPVRVIDATPPAGWVLVGPLPEVNVTVRGRSRSFARFEPASVPPIHVGAVDADQRSFRISPAAIRLPRGVDVLAITPDILPLDLQPIVRKEVPVRVNTRGRPARGHSIVGTPNVDPDFATLAGPDRYLRDVDQIFTEAIDLTDRDASFRIPVNLQAPNPLVSWSSDRPFHVEVTLENRRDNRRFDGIPVVLDGDLDPALVHQRMPETLVVTLEGPGDVLDALRPDALVVSLSLDDAQRNTPGNWFAEPVIRNLPADVTLVTFDVSRVLVSVARARDPQPEPAPE